MHSEIKIKPFRLLKNNSWFKRLCLISFSFFYLFLILIIMSPVISYPAEERIIAVVNDEAITQSDVEDYLAMLYFQLSSQYDETTLDSKMKEAEKEALDILIENKLIIQEARRQELKAENSIIERELEDIKKLFLSEKEFEEGMLSKGLSLADMKKRIADKIIMHDVIEKEVRSKIFVHPQEVTDYYQNHIEDFKVGKQVDLDSIFIPFSNSEDAAKETAYEVLALLKKGEDFSKVQKEYSETESLGLVKLIQLKREIIEAVSNLNIGDISLPIKVENGFFILKVKNIIPEYTKELSKAQDVIYGYLFQKKFEERFIEWTDELEKKAFILIK